MSDERMPMDNMEDSAPAPVIEQPPEPQQQETQEQQEARTRDEQGRFAAREGQPRGKPDTEARDRRLAQERDEFRTKYESLNKRLEDMSSLLKGDDPAAPKPELPAELKPLLEKIEGIDQRLTQRDQQAQEEQLWNQVRGFADQDEQRFSQEKPDFANAVQHYIQSRMTEMSAFGLPQDQAEAQLQQEAQQLLVQCAQGGRSPAATIYAMAQARGYQAGAVVHQDNQMPQPRQNVGGRSLGTGGGPAGGALTAQQIAAMSEEDYMAMRATPEGRRTIQRAMGGA